MKPSEIASRFESLRNSARRIVGVPREQPEPERKAPSPARERELALGDWAAKPEAAAFIAWLNEEIEAARVQAHANVGTPQGAYALGGEGWMRIVRDELLRLRGELPGKPPVSP